VIGVGVVRTQITRKVAKQACGTNSCSSPFIKVVITSFKRGGAVYFGEVLGPCPSPGCAGDFHERHPRHVQHRPGACTMVMVDFSLWRGVGSSARVQTRDGTRSSFRSDLNQVSVPKAVVVGCYSDSLEVMTARGWFGCCLRTEV
jgi:hypothetical protein